MWLYNFFEEFSSSVPLANALIIWNVFIRTTFDKIATERTENSALLAESLARIHHRLAFESLHRTDFRISSRDLASSSSMFWQTSLSTAHALYVLIQLLVLLVVFLLSAADVNFAFLLLSVNWIKTPFSFCFVLCLFAFYFCCYDFCCCCSK